MRTMKKYSSALRKNVLEWIEKTGPIDVLVGIPCYNNEETIGKVVSTAGQGLKKYFGDKKTAVFVSDGGSLDNTREEAYGAEIPDGVNRRVTIYRGIPGKGTSFRAVFEVAQKLGVKAVVVVDSDLRSITPEWIRDLSTPVLEGKAGFVAPYYIRHKFDGTITNQIVYPTISAVFGANMRQPIGGDFSFSGDLAAFYATQDVWDTDVARFGIDVWMSTTAIAEETRLAQVHLGTKVHDAKDPASDLGSMFEQVVSTLFYLIGRYQDAWCCWTEPKECPVVGEPPKELNLESVPVTMSALREEFVEGFGQFSALYQMILADENFRALKGIYRTIKDGGAPEFPSELWGKIIFDFAAVYHVWTHNRRRLVNIMTPLYFGRTASYCHEVQNMSQEEAEEVVRKQAKVFAGLRSYLEDRMDQFDQAPREKVEKKVEKEVRKSGASK